MHQKPTTLALAAFILIGTGAMLTSQANAQAPAPPTPAPSTQPPQPMGVAAEVQTSYARLKGYISKAAADTPAEEYQVKPTPEIRTFARVVEHVVEAQNRICGSLNHVAPADMVKPPADTADKATILDALKASFAGCDTAYAGLTEANMTEMFAFGPVKRTRIGMLWGNVAHDNEQYATLALYMRLKGHVPPSSEK
jgi:DinB superfamily